MEGISAVWGEFQNETSGLLDRMASNASTKPSLAALTNAVIAMLGAARESGGKPGLV